MDIFQSGQVEMFVNVTGGSEADARAKLQAHRGDLNAAIDSYLSEKENSVAPLQVEEADIPDWMDEDEPPPRQRIVPPSSYPLPSAPSWASGWPSFRGFGTEGAMAPRFPYRETHPIVTQPRDLREIPIDWRDEEPRVRSNAGLLIEEISATDEASPPSQVPHVHIVADEDEATGPFSSAFRAANESRPRSDGSNMDGDFTARHLNSNVPLTNETTAMASNEGDDIDDEVLRAVIEASQRETKGMGLAESSRDAGISESQWEAEEDDIAQAVSLSLKTAEQEKAMREGKGFPFFSEAGIFQDYPNSEDPDVSKRRGLSSTRGTFSAEDRDELEEQPRRRLGRQPNSALTPFPIASLLKLPEVRQEPSNAAGVAEPSVEQNGNAAQNDEWGGLSPEEQAEAVMLEATLFGPLPEISPIQHPPSPSPTVVAQRLLREQQDDEYLASLVADREKEKRAQLDQEARRLKHAEAKAAADAEERLRQDEELHKCIAKEELEKQIAAKRAALSEEPAIDSENAVTLMVRLPDGTRRGRRFCKSDPLQCLFDFIDASCGPFAGPYRLVRSYPRKPFTDAERGRSLHELGLNSKYETLFLELI